MATSWVDFYQAMADRLLGFVDKPKALYTKIKTLAVDNPLMGYLHFENGARWRERDFEIDPFSVMAIFNRGVTDAHRTALAQSLGDAFGVGIAPPAVFHGIPHLDPRNSMYEGNDQLWRLFTRAMNPEYDSALAESIDAAIGIKGNAIGTISIALYWIRPLDFIPVDKVSLPWIEKQYGLVLDSGKCSGKDYLEYNASLRAKVRAANSDYPTLTFSAWQAMHMPH